MSVFADAYQAQLHPQDVAVGSDGVPASRPGWTEDWYYHLCPVRQRQRDYTLRFIEELVNRYPIDGIDLDFIRFPWKATNTDGPERYFCFCNTCKDQFQEATGRQVNAEPGFHAQESWNVWRAAQITSMINDVRMVIGNERTLTPFVAFWRSDGLGVGELNKATQRFGQDHSEIGRVATQLAPMLYQHFTAEPTCYTSRSIRWVRDITSHLVATGSSVCTVVQGGPPASPDEVTDAVHGAADAGATAVMSYPGLSWTMDNAYWVALAASFAELASAEEEPSTL